MTDTNKAFKVASILTDHSIAIRISKEEAAECDISIGDKAKIVLQRIDIKDPDGDGILGSYTTYKDTLEVTEIADKYIVATKIIHKSPVLPIQIGGTREVGKIELSSSSKIATDKTIKVGDLVDFFG